jgi:pSer/pThr/pTyr-binding forkhead associated (FHA) protein
MSVLRTIESKLESLFEGVFGRAFRSNVQPVEIARKLVKEMDEHRSVSVSRVYVPNEYTVFLSPADHEQFAGYEENLCDELQEYLAEHARRERYVLLSPPSVRLETDDDLELGLFGIQTRLARIPAAAAEPAPAPPRPRAPAAPAAATAIFIPPVELPPEPAAAPVAQPATVEVAVVTIGEQRHELGTHAVTLGRSKECDIQVMDPNVSRRHAQIRPVDDGYTLVDLGSTNGIEVDGRRVSELALEDGSRFTIGSTEVAFSRETR